MKVFASVWDALEAAARLAINERISVGGRMAEVTRNHKIRFLTDNSREVSRPADGRFFRSSFKGAKTVEEK